MTSNISSQIWSGLGRTCPSLTVLPSWSSSGSRRFWGSLLSAPRFWVSVSTWEEVVPLTDRGTHIKTPANHLTRRSSANQSSANYTSPASTLLHWRWVPDHLTRCSDSPCLTFGGSFPILPTLPPFLLTCLLPRVSDVLESKLFVWPFTLCCCTFVCPPALLTSLLPSQCVKRKLWAFNI